MPTESTAPASFLYRYLLGAMQQLQLTMTADSLVYLKRLLAYLRLWPRGVEHQRACSNLRALKLVPRIRSLWKIHQQRCCLGFKRSNVILCFVLVSLKAQQASRW